MASMAIIPPDIIVDILYLLPTESLARFRCVSKEWLSLLTDPRFIETHKKTLNRIHFIFRSNCGSLYSVPYDNHHEAVSLTKLDIGCYSVNCILGSVNGLVLASAFKNLDTFVPLLVLNPTTKDYVELPISNQMQYCGIKGIGYDSVSDDYKVVVIAKFEKYRGNVYVYNVRTNTWKRATRKSPYHHNDKSWMSGVFVNGHLHWICDSHSKQVIIAFSLADEILSELPPPIWYNEVIVSDPDTKLVALGEKLAIFHELKGDVWLMNEYGVQKSWTKIVVHGFKEIPLIRPQVFYNNGKILFLTSSFMWIYDVEERTFCESVDISCMNIRSFIIAYAENLVSPKFNRTKKKSAN